MGLRKKITEGIKKILTKPEKRVAFFPGQGTQRLGMGRFIEGEYLKSVLKDIKDVLGQRIGNRIEHLISLDPDKISKEEKAVLEDDLNTTSTTQLAIATVGIAEWEAYLDEVKSTSDMIVLGHSVGELVAAYASGVLKRKDVIWLVYQRGQRMALCCPIDLATREYKFGMVAVVGDEEIDEKIVAGCLKRTKVRIANFNSPKQIALSGEREELRRVSLKIKENGYAPIAVRRVAGAFHHQKYMATVEEELKVVLSPSNQIRRIEIREPVIDMLFNYTGGYEKDPNRIRTYFIQQVSNTVRMRQEIEELNKKNVRVSNIKEFCGSTIWKGTREKPGILSDFPAFDKLEQRIAKGAIQVSA